MTLANPNDLANQVRQHFELVVTAMHARSKGQFTSPATDVLHTGEHFSGAQYVSGVGQEKGINNMRPLHNEVLVLCG